MTDLAKKGYVLGAVILLCFFLLIFTEEKVEFEKETLLWKFNVERIEFEPGAREWNREQHYIEEPVLLQRKGSLFDKYYFTVKTKDPQGKELLYEGGYSVKNLFSELSTPRSRMVVSHTAENMDKLGIEPGKSPVLHLYSGSEQKSITIGEKSSDGNLVYFTTGQGIYGLYSFIFEKLKDKVLFRERQIVSGIAESIKKIQLKDASGTVRKLRNDEGVWKKQDQKASAAVENAYRSLRSELYPDQENGGGLDVALILVKDEPSHTLEFVTADNTLIELKTYPPTNIKNVKYIPYVRSIRGQFTESPAYMNKIVFDQFMKIFE